VLRRVCLPRCKVHKLVNRWQLELGIKEPEPYLGRLLQHFWGQSLGEPTELVTRLFGEEWVDRLGRGGQ